MSHVNELQFPNFKFMRVWACGLGEGGGGLSAFANFHSSNQTLCVVHIKCYRVPID